MNDVAKLPEVTLQTKLVALAREIAYDLKPISDILKELSISEAEFEIIKNSKQFRHVVSQEIANWNSALNATERVKLKSQYIIEMSLEEFYARLHDKNEPLSSRVELAKLIAKLGGVDQTKQEQAAGERFHVTINLGADQTLTIDKQVTHKVIEGEAL